MIRPESLQSIGIMIHGVRNVATAEALNLCSMGAVMLDLRPDYATVYKQFVVDRVIYMPPHELYERIPGLLPQLCYITADASGLHSREVARALMETGFGMVVNLAGGMVDWERQGGAVGIQGDARLSGSCMCQLRPR